MDEFWGKHYGPARRLAWRALGWFAAVGIGYVAVLTLLGGTPHILRLVAVMVGALPVLFFLVRYVVFEIRALRALGREYREGRGR